MSELKSQKGTKVIAYIGTILVWIPVLLTLLTGAAATIASGILRVNYLMPAELFPLVLIGAVLLLWATIRSSIYRKHIAWTLVIMACSLAASQGAAILTGLASGKTEAAGWPLVLVVSLLALYICALIAQCILGVLLIRKLRALS